MLRYTYVINKTRIALTASFWKVKIGHLQTNVPKIGIPMLKAPLYRPLVISYHSSWNLLFPGAWLEGGEVSPALFQNLKKSALNLGKNVLTRFIYRFNFSFKMLFLAYLSKKYPNKIFLVTRLFSSPLCYTTGFSKAKVTLHEFLLEGYVYLFVKSKQTIDMA